MIEPIFPTNQTQSEEEAESMMRIHEEALKDQPDEWNPAKIFSWMFPLIYKRQN